MAILKSHQITWLLQSWIVLFLLLFYVGNVQTLEETPEKVEIKLRNCCSPETTNEGENCKESITLDWNYLKSFRIPRADDVDVTSIIIDSTLAVNENVSNSLECDGSSIKQFIIPSWDQPVPRRGFFAFFSKDGHFQYDENIFDNTEFCIDRQAPTLSENNGVPSPPEAIIVSVCTSRESQCSSANFLRNDTEVDHKTCLVRCCDYGEAWTFGTDKIFRCKDSGEHIWKPKIYSNLDSDKEFIPYENGSHKEELPLTMVYHPRNLKNMMNCKDKGSFQLSSVNCVKQGKSHVVWEKVGKKPFKILKDGNVWVKIRKFEWVQLQLGEYCIDGFQYEPGKYSGDNSDALLYECAQYETEAEQEGRQRQRKYSLVFGILLVFCLCFLLMTILVYILLWSKHNYHGFTVFCYIVALFLTYLSLGVGHFSSIILERESNHKGIWTFCGVLGIICHFTFLSVFSWSTVLNFDLWCTFRNLRPSNRKSRGVKRFLAYALFALAVPIIIVTIGILLDEAYGDDGDCSDIITPQYGRAVCFVEPRYARFYFVILPIAILLGTNLVLFCNTAISVYKVKKSTQFASSSSTKNETSHQTFRLILKLMLVNGTLWIIEIISWYLQAGYEEVGLPAFILDVINIFQAVAIFFLFVFKNDILEALKKGYPRLEGAVALAYKIKQFGRSGNHAENPSTSMDTSCNSKPTENVQTSNV